MLTRVWCVVVLASLYGTPGLAQRPQDCPDPTPAPGPVGFNVRDFDAYGNDEVDDTGEIQCAIDAAEAYGGPAVKGAQVYFPAGVYIVSSTLTLEQHYVSLRGEGGRYTTTIKRAASFTSGDTIRVVNDPMDHSKFAFGNNISDLRLVASADTTSGAHLHLINSYGGVFSNLTLDEQFGGLLIQGGWGLTFENMNIFSDLYFTAMKAGSYFVKIEQSSPTNPVMNATDMKFVNGNWRTSSGLARVEHGLRVHSSDAIYFTQIHVMGGAVSDVLIEPGSTTTQVSGLRFSNCWFDPGGTSATAGVLIQGQTAKPFGLFAFDQCVFYGGGGQPTALPVTANGVRVSSVSLAGLAITGSTIHGYGTHGVHLIAGSNVLLSANQISNNNTNGPWGIGILAQSSVPTRPPLPHNTRTLWWSIQGRRTATASSGTCCSTARARPSSTQVLGPTSW